MSFDDKRKLLHLLFDGKDKKGTPYGIYINKIGKRNNIKIDYFLYGNFVQGLRTLKGDDINYVDEKDDYTTNKVTINNFSNDA